MVKQNHPANLPYKGLDLSTAIPLDDTDDTVQTAPPYRRQTPLSPSWLTRNAKSAGIESALPETLVGTAALYRGQIREIADRCGRDVACWVRSLKRSEG